LPSLDDIAIVPLTAERIDELRELWLALHHAHREVANVPLQPDDELSWRLRRADYLEWLRAGSALVLGAERGSQLVGYALTRVHEGGSDTFDLGSRHAEVWSLSVSSAERGRGIGTLLLDAVDRELERRGIHHLAIAVMEGNDAARRFYERRGLIPAETLLLRPPPATP
jgi:ribosomal protein S18 acetylase RimI-like enzyme